MAFVFNGGLIVNSGSLELGSGSSIILTSGSDISLGEGSTIFGNSDLDGSFSGSFTGSLLGTSSYATTASFALNSFDGVSSSHALRADTADQVSFDVITGLPLGLVTTSAQITAFGFISSSTQFDPSSILAFTASADAEITALMAATSSFLTSSTPFDPTDIDARIDGIEAKTGSFITSSTPFDAADILAFTASADAEITALMAATSSYLTGIGNIIDSSSHAAFAISASIANTASFALNSFDGISSSHAIRADVADSVPFNVISNLPTDLVSSSAQITAFGFISSSGDDPDSVNSASHATFAEEAATVHFDNRDDDNTTFTIPLLDSYNSVTGRSGSLLVAGATGGQGLIEFNPSQSILHLGRTSRDGILKVNRIDIGSTNIIIGGSGDDDKNISMLQGGVAFSSISSPPAAASSNGLLIRSGSLLYFATGSQYQAVVTDSSQVDVSLTTGSIPGSRVVGDIQASSVEYGNVLNKPTLISGSSQVDLASATGIAAQALTASYIFYDGIETEGANWISSSTQITSLGFMSSSDSGTVSGSAQITEFGFISESFSTTGTSIVSSSAQITAQGFISESFSTAGTGITSGSAQVVNLLDGQDVNLGTVTAVKLDTTTVSSSVLFTSGSNIIGDELTDTHQFTGSVTITGSLDVAGVTFISSSAQITAFGFISSSGDDPDSVNSASHAIFAETADTASHALIANTASHAEFADNAEDAVSASFASNASTADRADAADSVTFANVTNKPTLVSSSAQITLSTTNGNLATSRLSGTISADNIDVATDNTDSYRNLLFVDGTGNDKSVYVSSSLRYNPSLDILRVGMVEGTTHTASYVDFDNVENKPTLISGSAQVDLASATGTAATATRATRVDTVASSFNSEQEVIFTDGSGNSKQAKVDSSFTYNSSTNVLTVPNVTGTASRATTASFAEMARSVDFEYVENLPSGLVSSSAQVDVFNSGLVVKGGNLSLGGNISLSLSGSTASHLRYITSEGDNKTFLTADHVNDFIKFSNRAANGYFNFFANNATEGSGGEQKVAEFRHDEAQFFQKISGSSIEVSGNIEGDISLTTGNISGSRVVGDIQASSVEYSNVLNKPTLLSGSQQIIDLGFVQTTGSDPNLVPSSSHAEFAETASLALAVNFDVITGLPDNLVSSSAQINIGDTIGNISGSRVIGDIQASSVEYDNVLNKPTLISSSAQVDLTSATGTAANATSASFATTASFAEMARSVDFEYVDNLPDNLVSSSAQIDLASATGTAANATSASYVDMDNIDFSTLTHYDDDAAAATGGVPVGKLYRNGNFIQVRLS